MLCSNAECHAHYAGCRILIYFNAEYYYPKYHYTECHYAECHYAECRGANFYALLVKKIAE
jgi:hypothetical protein